MIDDMANTLTGLLKGQTIWIDNHHKGIANVWDDKYDIHLHKQPNNKNVDYDIKINLNREQDESVLDKLPAKIRKEVKKATSNPEILKNFYEEVYKYLSENFGWNGDGVEENTLINNIAKAFDILPFKHIVEVTNSKTNQRNVIQMMRQRDSEVPYHISFNYSTQCVYIGQFQFGDMTSIHEYAQKSWAETLERNFRDILTAPDMKAKLSVLAKQTPGIGKKVVDTTFDAIERIYGNKSDFTDEETK